MTIVGIDAGGTFTDFLVLGPGGIRTHKVFSSKDDPAGAVARGLADLGLRNARVVHGTTLATNAFLERKGARIALVTTRGFEDLVEIGRQNRPRLYDLDIVLPPALVPRSLRIGVDERVAADGRVLRRIGSLVEARRLSRKAEAIAICFLHSYVRPQHERQVARALTGGGRPISLSSEVCREYREYERLTTTVLNAYVQPIMQRYLGRLSKSCRGLEIMGSSGGRMPASEAASLPVHTLLSGPAGGATALEAVCRRTGIERAIAIDIGGTSADVSLYDGAVRVTKEGSLGGLPLRIPILEIHTVGAGGGSIARIDAGGALRVGPESAGAEPGPACYGRGGRRPTVTDANVVLGRIDPRRFFGGRLELDRAAAERSLKTLGRDPRKAATAVIDVVDAAMERALRVVSVERGRDPAGFTLVAFGGAGPLHACSLADRLSIRRILVPRWPGLFSALGMVLADEVREVSRTVLGRDVAQAFRELGGMKGRIERFVDGRYPGQSYEIRTPWRGHARDFHELHRRRYGYRRDDDPEVVNVIVRATVPRPKARFPLLPRGGGRPRPVAPGVYERGLLRAGERFRGPAQVAEDNATTYVAPGWSAEVDPMGNLRLWR